MKKAWLLAAALSVLGGVAAAQSVAPGATPAAEPVSPAPAAPLAPVAATAAQPAAAPAPAPIAGGISVAADTPVRIELAEAVSSKDRKRGDKFAIRLARPLVADGRVLAPAGATGVGEVVYAEAGGGGGSPGKLVLAARYIDVGPVRMRLKAFNLSAGGESDFREMQLASEFVGPVVLLINGHDVDYPPGTRAGAKLAEDVILPAGPPADEASAAAAPAAGPVPAAMVRPGPALAAPSAAGPAPSPTNPAAAPASATSPTQETAK